MEGEFALNLEKVLEGIDGAEVMSIFFPTFHKALVIDTRYNEAEGPMVRIMAMVASPQERVRSLLRLRPGFPRIRSLTVIPWPRYVESLVTLGIWDRIVARVAGSGHDGAVEACDKSLEELQRLEKAELAAVVIGHKYQAIWSSNGR